MNILNPKIPPLPVIATHPQKIVRKHDGSLVMPMVAALVTIGVLFWYGPTSMSGASAHAAQSPRSLALEHPADANTVIVRAGWVTLRAAPRAKGKAIGIAFGNDAFPVLSRKKGWVRVRLEDHRMAWLPQESLEEATPPTPPEADTKVALAEPPSRLPKQVVGGLGDWQPRMIPETPALPRTMPEEELARAQGLQASGFRVGAREIYLNLLLLHPSDRVFYEAMRGMNDYYPLGNFPKVRDGELPDQGLALAQGKLAELFILEGEARLDENRPLDAVAAFEWALLHGGGLWQRATTGLREALVDFLSRKDRNEKAGIRFGLMQPEAVALARELWKDYFPHEPVPGPEALATASLAGGGLAGNETTK